jgi:hypothetical protein
MKPRVITPELNIIAALDWLDLAHELEHSVAGVGGSQRKHRLARAARARIIARDLATFAHQQRQAQS